MDYLIIGAGPAGLQLGYLLQKAGRDFKILEAGEIPGKFFQQYPRHRTLISVNKPVTGITDPEVNLRMDWNSLLGDEDSPRFTEYSKKYFPPAEKMVEYLADYAASSQLPIEFNSRVTSIGRKPNGAFLVRTQSRGEFEAKRVIVATGISIPYIPPIPGIETTENYSNVSVDPMDFLNQKVLIIGKGNSAFETADNLMETTSVIHVAGPSSLKLAWKTHFVGHLRAVNNNFLDTYQLKSQNALIDGDIEKIEKKNGQYEVTVKFVRSNEVRKKIRYDRIITCTGFQFDSSLFAPECRPELTLKNRFPAQNAFWESTNVPDLFFAGVLMQAKDYKKSTSAFVHGFRYSVRSLFKVLQSRYENSQWEHRSYPAKPKALCDAILNRVNRTSGLWQQFDFLRDAIVFDGTGADYYEELTLEYLQQSNLSHTGDYLTISLEYGPNHDKVDPFDVSISRVSQDESDTTGQGQYLHPVIRSYKNGELQATHHVTENLENDWTDPEVHELPLRKFLGKVIPNPNFLEINQFDDVGGPIREASLPA